MPCLPNKKKKKEKTRSERESAIQLRTMSLYEPCRCRSNGGATRRSRLATLAKQRVRVDRRRLGRDAAHLPELIPLLHAGGHRSRQPPPRPRPPPIPPPRHRLLLLLLRSPRHPDSHLHLLLWPQNPRHRALLRRRPPQVGGCEGGEL